MIETGRCMKCRTQREMINPELIEKVGSRGKRFFNVASCTECQTKIWKITKTPELPPAFEEGV